MHALFLGITLGVALASPRIGQNDEQPLTGALLLSSDSTFVKRVRTLVRAPFKPFLEFEKSFDPERFMIRKWGAQRVIVIDRLLPMFHEREQKQFLLMELANRIDKDLIVKLSDLSRNKENVLASTVERVFPPSSRPDGFDISKSAVGVDATVNVTAHFRNGEGNKTVKIPLDPATSFRRNRALDQYAMPPKGRELTIDELKMQAQRSEEYSSALEQVPYHAFGTTRGEIQFGIRESAEMIRELMASFDLKNKQAADSLLEKLGILALGELPKGKVPFDQLPSEVRKQFTDALEGSWKSLGYSNQDEAAAAMAGASSFEISVNVGLYRSFRAFDPVTKKPGSGMVYNFILIRP